MSSSHDGYLSDGEAISLMPVYSQSEPKVPEFSRHTPLLLFCFFCPVELFLQLFKLKVPKKAKNNYQIFFEHKTFLLGILCSKEKLGR